MVIYIQNIFLLSGKHYLALIYKVEAKTTKSSEPVREKERERARTHKQL